MPSVDDDRTPALYELADDWPGTGYGPDGSWTAAEAAHGWTFDRRVMIEAGGAAARRHDLAEYDAWLASLGAEDPPEWEPAEDDGAGLTAETFAQAADDVRMQDAS